MVDRERLVEASGDPGERDHAVVSAAGRPRVVFPGRHRAILHAVLAASVPDDLRAVPGGRRCAIVSWSVP